MGRRKARKRDRRREQRFLKEGGEARRDEDLWAAADSRVSWDLLTRPAAAPAATCGSCREFVEDPEGGRGQCGHPASGIVSPWPDTPACPFYAWRRGR
jgi:hypothetical protein